MADDSDWRLTGQEKYLQGVSLQHRRYRRPLNGIMTTAHFAGQNSWLKIILKSFTRATALRMSTIGFAMSALRISKHDSIGLYKRKWIADANFA
jgi:hypothetical protein